MAKQTITNTTEGPRVVNGAEGPVTIPAGGSVEVDLSEAEFKVAKSTEWFDFGKTAKPKGEDGKE